MVFKYGSVVDGCTIPQPQAARLLQWQQRPLRQVNVIYPVVLDVVVVEVVHYDREMGRLDYLHGKMIQ